MYGLVNKAIEDLICEKFGEDKWDEILEDSGIGIDGFVSMEHYDDSVTYNLVASISKILDMPPEVVLKTFGHYWTTYTASKGYENLLALSGDTIQEFLFNIDELHARVAGIYPNLVPPSFATVKIDDTHFEIEYKSKREGLSPMIIGLFEGIGERFNKEVKVEQIEFKEKDGMNKFSFKIL